jgi:AraC-like DNA-binding protein
MVNAQRRPTRSGWRFTCSKTSAGGVRLADRELAAANVTFSLLFLLGAVQGLFLAAVLAGRRPRLSADRLLAGLMLVFSLDLAAAVYHASGFHERVPAFIGADYSLSFLYGPLVYLYAAALLGHASRVERRHLWHFAPFALVAIALVPYYLQPGPERLAALYGEPDAWLSRLAVLNHFKLPHGLAYIGATALLIRRAQRAGNVGPGIAWLRQLTIGVGVLTGLSVVLYVLQSGASGVGLAPDGILDRLTLLAVTVFVYGIGYHGLRQPALSAVAPARNGMATELPRPRYERSGLDDAQARDLLNSLLAHMDTEKPYHRGDLTLQDLADALGVAPHLLTEVLNTRLERSFYDFVNGYRVREVQARIADPASAHLSLLAIGLEAGFNSKSTFNAAFKKHAGQTPSEYRRHLLANQAG